MPTVLVADSNATFATVVADALQRLSGVDVAVAASGPEALAKAGGARLHVAVVDGALPDADIPALIRALRAGNPDLPVVLMPVSAADVPPDLVLSGVLTKPFFLPDLAALVTELLGALAPALPAAPPVRAASARRAVTAPLGAPAPLRARLGSAPLPGPAAPALTPAPSPAKPPPAAPWTASDETRRRVESCVERLSRALRDEPVLLSHDGRVLVSVPRLSASATAALAQVIQGVWQTAETSGEVIRFEGETEINRYMLYSLRIAAERPLILSVALRVRISLPVVRRIVRDTALELAAALAPAE